MARKRSSTQRTAKKKKLPRRVAKQPVQSVEALCDQAAAAFKAEDYEKSLLLAEQVVAAAPDLWRGYALRGDAKRELEDYEAAMVDLDRALEMNPTDAWTVRNRGAALFDLGNLDAAMEHYTRAIKLDPRCGHFLADRGVTSSMLGDHATGLRDMEAALALDDNEANWWNWKACMHEHLGHVDQAIEASREAQRRDPKAAFYPTNLGNMFVVWGRYEEAIEEYTRALNVRSTYVEALEPRSLCYANLEQYDKVVEDCTAILAIKPGDWTALSRRASAYRQLGNEDLADLDYEALENLHPSDDEEDDDSPMQYEKDSDGTKTITSPDYKLLFARITDFFGDRPFSQLSITARRFPWRMRPNLQLAVEQWIEGDELSHFCGKEYYDIASVLERDRSHSANATAPRYDEIEVGSQRVIRCLKAGLWLTSRNGLRYVLLMRCEQQIGFEIAAENTPAGQQLTRAFFAHMEAAVQQSQLYRGQILSLDSEESYSGRGSGFRVHELPLVPREDVILPEATLALLDRNIVRFAEMREKLAARGLPTKKGLLFFGPPGTGKTHTLQYLAHRLKDHTTLLITAEQVGNLREYLTLARLLQPSIVVLEDVDLIARQRQNIGGAMQEVLLNQLLNEMDGLRADAQIFFILTTNHPEVLEEALAARPGRIDQAIEFPLPDDQCRRQLLKLYAAGVQLSDEVVESAVARTKDVSASFIKELVRRAVQYQLERDENGALDERDIEHALDEMLQAGGVLNRVLLGATRRVGFQTP